MMWGFGGVFFILCVGMIWMMFGHGMMGHGHGDTNDRRAHTPEHILAERFARGEIDVEEYDRRLTALSGRDGSQA